MAQCYGIADIPRRFVVYEAVFGPGDTIQRFRATFEQHCEGAPAALHGEIMIVGNPPR